jgi:phage shock protein A
MGIFSRLTDIINSNVNSILDRAEDPEKMIRLMIQEMEDTLVEVRSTAARVIADKKEAERKLSRLEQAQAEWQRKAELALTKGRDDLARGALVEKSKLAETAQAMKQELPQLDSALAKHEQDIAKLEEKLREVKAKQKLILARQQSVSSQVKVRQRVYDNRIEEAFTRFEQIERRLDKTEGEAEAYDLGRGKSLSEEISELETDHAVDAELEALRAHLKRGGSSTLEK